MLCETYDILQLPPHHLVQRLDEQLQPYPVLVVKRSHSLTIDIQHSNNNILFLAVFPPPLYNDWHHNLALRLPIAEDMPRSRLNVRHDDGIAVEKTGGADSDGAGGAREEGDGGAGWSAVVGAEEEGRGRGYGGGGGAGEEGGEEVEPLKRT